MKRSFRSFALAALAAAVLSCTESVTIAPPIAISLAIESGQAVTAAAGTSLAPTPTVRVTDASGAPVAGARVLFAVTRGKGSVMPAEVATGADGRAALTFWQYGTAVGPQQLTASVVSSTSDARVVFNGTAVAGPTASLAVSPAQFVLAVGATRQLTVNAADRFGNPTGSAVAATFTSGNTAIATVSTTGLVTAIGSGAATITAVYQSATVIATVVVTTTGGTRPQGSTVKNISLGDRPYSVATSPQGTLYAVRVDAAEFTRVNLPDTTINSTFAMASPAYDLAFLPDGETAYMSNTPGNFVSVVGRANNNVQRTISGLGEPYRIRASPTGSHVYLTTSGGKLHRLTVGSDVVTTITLAGALNGLAIDSFGSKLYATNYDGNLFEVDLSTFTLSRTLRLGGFPQGIAIAPDGRTLYIANENAGLHVVDVANLTLTSTVGLTGAFDVLVTLDGEELYVTRPGASVVSVLRVADLTVLREISGGTPRRMALNTDGSILVIANESGYLTVVK